jgi:hypothetical protein
VPKKERTTATLPTSLPVVLPSDTTSRTDSCALIEGDIEAAQANKNELEELQRHDRKLREAAAKRREKGGPKISFTEY